MKISIMQPYFFPYIGYYQLAYSVDEFIFFDDVNFIKKGYINRNEILLNKERFRFTLPIHGISQFKKINEHFYIDDFRKFKNHLTLAYRDAPFFTPVMSMLEKILQSEEFNVAEINSKTLIYVFEYLKIPRSFSFSSDLNISDSCSGEDRIIEICKLKKCSSYHNAAGGRDLYKKESFAKNNIDIGFVKNEAQDYMQGNSRFIFERNLSMLDVLMWCPPQKIVELLKQHKIES
ncbi:hypothetical protein DJFAAGMI_04878 [Comamonas sp. PE63]|uniref:WbqC-like protein family protein n=1 Tax=Comamonas brasiliensis TaxID=1812482 RepID=A0ABS5M0L2_9BURK|nr:WbqC family protein [Comamonas sp. PE63]MBS3022097.1 hypothetical protein [Comamonas sp. PE63]